MLQKNKVVRKLSSRRGAVVLAIGVMAGLATAPSSAQAGFFDQLFGVFQAPAPTPTPSYDYDRAPRAIPRESRHIRKHVATISDKPILQKTTGLMEDKTLRAGDAVMMQDGVHVYAGPGSASHDRDQFVPLDDARRLSERTRIQLASMDTTRNDPLTRDNKPDTIASGRSAAVGTSVVAGYRITDAKGASVRYVGP